VGDANGSTAQQANAAYRPRKWLESSAPPGTRYFRVFLCAWKTQGGARTIRLRRNTGATNRGSVRWKKSSLSLPIKLAYFLLPLPTPCFHPLGSFNPLDCCVIWIHLGIAELWFWWDSPLNLGITNNLVAVLVVEADR